MPNRIIKESIRTSRNVNSLSDFNFRVWVYLITYADDAGRGSADPELLKGMVFPRRKGVTESQIQKALTELANMGMVILYEVDGEPYLRISDWDETYPQCGRHTIEYTNWRKAVFARDDYTCQHCGKRGGKLCAHHIKRYHSHIELRTDIDNGITLCERCHKELHHREGY